MLRRRRKTQIATSRPYDFRLQPSDSPGVARRRGRNKRMHGSKPIGVPPTDHLILLAGSPDGYRSLSRLVTTAQFRGKKDQPVYLWDDLVELAKTPDLVALSGCHRGEVPGAAARGDLAGAMSAAIRLREIFGSRFHLELWHHGMPEDDPRNDLMMEVAGRLNLPTVATNNVHYHQSSEADLSEVLAAIDGRRSLDRADGFRPATDERYLKSPAEMEARFRRYNAVQTRPGSKGPVEAAARLGQNLTFDLRLIAPRLPDFPMPGHFRSEMEYLRHLTWEAAREIYPGHGEGLIEPGARTRLEHELGIIERLGFAGYFLVVWDIVNFARDQDIYCQIRGRGRTRRCAGVSVSPGSIRSVSGFPLRGFCPRREAAHPTSTSISRPIAVRR